MQLKTLKKQKIGSFTRAKYYKIPIEYTSKTYYETSIFMQAC